MPARSLFVNPILAVIACSGLAGCSTPEIVPAGPDTYTVAAGGGLGFTPSSAPVRASVYKAANKYCADRGLVMMPVSIDVQPGQQGKHTASVELVFRALPPGDPEIDRPNIERPTSVQRIQQRH